MMRNAYLIAASIFILFVFLFYVGFFYFRLEYPLSESTEHWAQFGDYFGGVLNPILSFITIFLLIRSLDLQNDANKRLKVELANNEKSHKYKSFEALFFNMLDSQKKAFETLCVSFRGVEYKNVDCVILVEKYLERIRDQDNFQEKASALLDGFDTKDQIFGILRVFYIVVKTIDEKLSNKNGFSSDDRKTHYETLINFTDFSQVRLVLICLQFMDYPAVNYIKSNAELNAVFDELGLSYDLY